MVPKASTVPFVISACQTLTITVNGSTTVSGAGTIGKVSNMQTYCTVHFNIDSVMEGKSSKLSTFE